MIVPRKATRNIESPASTGVWIVAVARISIAKVEAPTIAAPRQSFSLGLATAAITVNMAISAAPRPFLASPISAAPPNPSAITGMAMASSRHWRGAFSGCASPGEGSAVAAAVVIAGTLNHGF